MKPFNYVRLEQLGLTMKQVEQYSERHGYRCQDKEDYIANAEGMKRQLDDDPTCMVCEAAITPDNICEVCGWCEDCNQSDIMNDPAQRITDEQLADQAMDKTIDEQHQENVKYFENMPLEDEEVGS